MFRKLTFLFGRAAAIVFGAVLAVHAVLRLAPGAGVEVPDITAWLRAALVGDFGESSRLRVGEPVAGMFLGAAAESTFVVGLATLISLAGAAILTYIWTASPGSRLSAGLRGAVYLISSSPVFLLSYWVFKVLNAAAHGAARGGWRGALDWYHAELSPTAIKYWVAAAVLATGNGMLMEAARALDAEVRRLLDSDFVLFGRSRGHALWRHLGLSMVAPITSSVVNRLTSIFGSSIVVEIILNIPGLGRLTWDAALERDVPVLIGAAAVWAGAYAACHIAADVVASAVDPRLRVQSVEATV